MRRFAIALAALFAFAADPPAEREGVIRVEAESFAAQHKTSVRKWHVVKAPAGHSAGASGGAYVEALPDTRTTHDDKLTKGENFTDDPGTMAVLDYPVRFTTPGRYYVWVRAYSTGTEDNSIHVGVDGTWPESGKRMQWCEGKNSWQWASKQRTVANHCGEPGKIYLDIDKPGLHTISFSMREDGFEFDSWIMTTNPSLQPPEQAQSARYNR
jgi:hypothetical protein